MSDRKTELRAEYRRRRRHLTAADRRQETAAIVDALRRVLSADQVSTLASYAATAEEVDLDQLHRWWWSLGRELYLPSSHPQGVLSWHAVLAQTPLRTGRFGIQEPDPSASPAQPLPLQAAILVPGLAYGRDGRRLGQGAGYYDRLLGRHPGPAIGIGFTCQACEDIPHLSHDQRLAVVVLGGEVIRVER